MIMSGEQVSIWKETVMDYSSPKIQLVRLKEAMKILSHATVESKWVVVIVSHLQFISLLFIVVINVIKRYD
jgi:hypothetical protein